MTETAAAAAAGTPAVPAGYDGPRACAWHELASAVDLANLVLRVLGAPPGAPPRWPSIGGDYGHIYHGDNLPNIRVVTHRGRVVSSVGIYPTAVRTPRGTISVGGINAFVTHPDHRRQGLGGAVLRDAHTRMQASGQHVGLLSTRIQDYYRKFGWESAGRQHTWVFDRGNVALLPDPAGLAVTEDWLPHLPELVALHNGDNLVAPRSAATFKMLAERKLRHLFVARRAGRPVAYAGVGGTAVREYGGDPRAVAALIRAVFHRLDDPDTATSERPPGQRATIELTVTTPALRTGLPALLAQAGIPHTLGYMGMIAILDAPGLFDALRLRDVELTPSDHGWLVQHEGHTLELTPQQLVKLVFGPERFPDFAPDLFPIDFFQWSLDRV